MAWTNFRHALLFLIFMGYLGMAQKGNYRYNNFGNRTILLAGNVTGSVEDFGLAYYNPARLTEVENNGFAFNAKAYEYSTYQLRDAIDENTAAKDSRFNTIPSMVAGTFSLFNTRFAYSVFTKYATNTTLRYNTEILEKNIVESISGSENFAVDFSVNSVLREQLVGLTWATPVTENLSLGISLFGSVYRNSGFRNLEYTIQAQDGGVAYYQIRPGFTQDSYGLLVKIGASYRLKKLELGLNVNLPYLEVNQNARVDFQNTIAGIGADTDQLFNYKLRGLEADRKEPLGISIGAGVSLGRNKLHLNIDFVKGLSSYQRIAIPDIDIGQDGLTPIAFDESRKDVFNFGLGAEIYISDRISLYGGFSTDYNAITTATNILEITGSSEDNAELNNDFIHTGFGTELKLKWARLILGATFTKNTSNFSSFFDFENDDIDLSDSRISVFSFTRWQFIAGLDIPFLNKMGKEDIETNQVP